MSRRSVLKVVIHDPNAAAGVVGVCPGFEESLLAAPGAFGTESGSRELRDRLMEAATYGII
jgi:hypothetical protein